MLKKTIVFFLIAIFSIAIGLTGCGGSKKNVRKDVEKTRQTPEIEKYHIAWLRAQAIARLTGKEKDWKRSAKLFSDFQAHWAYASVLYRAEVKMILDNVDEIPMSSVEKRLRKEYQRKIKRVRRIKSKKSQTKKKLMRKLALIQAYFIQRFPKSAEEFEDDREEIAEFQEIPEEARDIRRLEKKVKRDESPGGDDDDDGENGRRKKTTKRSGDGEDDGENWECPKDVKKAKKAFSKAEDKPDSIFRWNRFIKIFQALRKKSGKDAKKLQDFADEAFRNVRRLRKKRKKKRSQ